MAVVDELHPAITEFYAILQPILPGIPEPPPVGSSTLRYAVWFSTLNFYAQVYEDPDSPIPSRVLGIAERLGVAAGRFLGLPVPPMPGSLSYRGLGSWAQVMSSVASGDNWCAYSDHSRLEPMDILRSKKPEPELTMECATPHRTEYKVDSNDSKIVRTL